MKRNIEIRAAEGGKDAKLFVNDLANAYVRMANILGWTALVSNSENTTTIKLSGNNLESLDQEAGGHRIQRVSPTERRGRVHTSSVTVAVIDPSKHKHKTVINDSDFTVDWFSGTGKGGQHRNKKQNSCRVTHVPTGLCETRQGRKRKDNLRQAKEALIKAIKNIDLAMSSKEISSIRKQQIGSGMRGDKIRTYRFQDDIVTDHQTQKKAKCSRVMKGYFNLLWR